VEGEEPSTVRDTFLAKVFDWEEKAKKIYFSI